MKEIKSNKKNHSACLILGSNIQPEKYFPLAIRLLKKIICIEGISSTWETESIGSVGPNYINAAVLISTTLTMNGLKYQLLRNVEERLGRLRTEDKFAPRTMDIDIVVFDDKVIEQQVWCEPYLIIPCSEVIPELFNPSTKQTLLEIAIDLQEKHKVPKKLELLNLTG